MGQTTYCILVLSLIWVTLVFNKACFNPITFNVLDYGAVGDGNGNDTLAFIKLWNSTCDADTENANVIIPHEKTFLVYPITLSGPCKPQKINFLLSGTIIAPDSPDVWEGRDQGRWLIFRGVNGLNMSGSGTIDGRGKGWWDLICKRPPQQGCVTLAPTALSFINCNNVYISNISVIHSPQTHILVSGSKYVDFKFLTINSPETSLNTDGIHIDSSIGVSINSTNIGSGDDCVSIGDYTSNIYITDVSCGPGHGVSIGSLGRSGNEVQVENITVTHARFNRTTNGLRIKTWQTGKGHVLGVMYKNISFTDVKNPIIIDQYYCDVASSCEQTDTGVQISDVRYFDMFGTSNTKVAINLNCSQAVPCTKILLDTIQLESASPGQQVISSCNNAYGATKGIVEPKSCLPL